VVVLERLPHRRRPPASLAVVVVSIVAILIWARGGRIRQAGRRHRRRPVSGPPGPRSRWQSPRYRLHPTHRV